MALSSNVCVSLGWLPVEKLIEWGYNKKEFCELVNESSFQNYISESWNIIRAYCQSKGIQLEGLQEEEKQIIDRKIRQDIILSLAELNAIDSLKDKAHLILNATEKGVMLFSSMGAALKLDPMKIAVAEFWDVKGCPLGAALRRRFKKNKTYPKRKFKCVYSDELLENKGSVGDVPVSGTWDAQKAQINGSLVHITAIFGFTLCSLVVQDVVKSIQQEKKQ